MSKHQETCKWGFDGFQGETTENYKANRARENPLGGPKAIVGFLKKSACTFPQKSPRPGTISS